MLMSVESMAVFIKAAYTKYCAQMHLQNVQWPLI